MIARVHRPDPARGGRVPLVHVDAYRLGDAADPRAEIDDLDLDASVDDSVTVVEWGEGMVEQLVDAHLRVRIDRRDDDTRMVELDPHRRRLGRPAGETVRPCPTLLPAGWRRTLDPAPRPGRAPPRWASSSPREYATQTVYPAGRGPVLGVPAVPAASDAGC